MHIYTLGESSRTLKIKVGNAWKLYLIWTLLPPSGQKVELHVKTDSKNFVVAEYMTPILLLDIMSVQSTFVLHDQS